MAVSARTRYTRGEENNINIPLESAMWSLTYQTSHPHTPARYPGHLGYQMELACFQAALTRDLCSYSFTVPLSLSHPLSLLPSFSYSLSAQQTNGANGT